jgi:uncharacterized membrane protein YidH (DUF202 family)
MDRDPGVQNERTALAWQRTALSLLAGAAAVSRLTIDRLGPAALLCVFGAIPLALWVFLEARGRYRADAGLRPRRSIRGGRASASVALATAIMAATELAALVFSG